MTSNQLAYRANLENERHNRAQESETAKHNRISEALTLSGQLFQNRRSRKDRTQKYISQWADKTLPDSNALVNAVGRVGSSALKLFVGGK